MTRTSQSHAVERLGLIGTKGYSIFQRAPGREIEVLASSHKPVLTADRLMTAHAAEDPSMVWFAGQIGQTKASELAQSALLQEIGSRETYLLSDLFQGMRLGIILSCESEPLGAEAALEARAAALVLLMGAMSDQDSNVSAKELVYLEQASNGSSDEEIAEELQLSLRAVKERKRKSIEDLNASNIGHAIGIAKRDGLI